MFIMNRRTELYLKRKINSINLTSILEIEEKVDLYDIYSLVFLLYDVPTVALKRLSALSKVSSSRYASTLIFDWAHTAQKARTKTSWRYELLEALTTCQLNKIIKQLGFNVELVQEYFQPDNIHHTIISNPFKKVMYKLCENISSENLTKLRETLKSYGLKIDDEYKNCEMLILEMLCNNLISIGEESDKNKVTKINCNVEVLAKIVENIGLTDIAKDLRDTEMKYKKDRNIDETVIEDHVIATTSKEDTHLNKNKEKNKSNEKYLNESDNEDDIKVTANDFHDVFTIINDTKENPVFKHLKSDTMVEKEIFYPIKKRDRVGVCLIVNQEDFYPSKKSIESGVPYLRKRVGSNKDKTRIEETFSVLNFDVQVYTNLNDKDMLNKLQYIVKSEVKSDDSIFFLFLLSHGERDGVYAANSVRVEINIITDLLENAFACRNLNDIPKVLIIQACQDDAKLCQDVDRLYQETGKLCQDDVKLYEDVKIRPDGARYISRPDCLVFWAKLPQLYESEDGSVFIKTLCSYIRKYAKCEHLEDILTRVKNNIGTQCSMKNKGQMPVHCSTLRKKVFLVPPVKKKVKV